MNDEILQSPGDVRIKRLILVSAVGKFINVLDYLVELNIYESIFKPGLSGTLTLGDSRNLIKDFPILGEELLIVEFTTPGTAISIEKLFRVHSLIDKNYVSDGASQVYTLHFVSVEIFRDISNPIFRSFNGTPSDIITDIFNEYLRTTRNVSTSNSSRSSNTSDKLTNLTVLGRTKNNVRFVSPGWTPIQCINWLCGHAESAGSSASDFLFWETNKGFYFGSIDDIIRQQDKLNAGNYYYSSTLMGSPDTSIGKKMMGIEDITFKKVFDQLDNNMSGFLSSRVVNVDIMNKTYENYDYDYTDEYTSYSHLAGKNSLPLHKITTSRNPTTHSIVNYSIPKLYDIDNNFSERYKFVFGNRRSNLLRLQNFVMTVLIPGRTDLEAGSIIDITLPRGFPTAPEEKTQDSRDELYSGKYLITSINHKINPINHHITMEVTRDSINALENYG